MSVTGLLSDLIVGHHLHILKRIEVYKGKVIFHSLSNFALELPFQFDKNLRGKQPVIKRSRTLTLSGKPMPNISCLPIHEKRSLSNACQGFDTESITDGDEVTVRK
jgi:poly-gamma-glutamate synthesis protein (capsule biosynthesis protein)